VLAGAVPFLALLLLVQQSWSPLRALDGDVTARLNEVVAPSTVAVEALVVVTDGGGTGTAVYLLVLATAGLLIRGQRRFAACVAATGVGLAILVPVTKLLIGRTRPDVALPVVDLPRTASSWFRASGRWSDATDRTAARHGRLGPGTFLVRESAQVERPVSSACCRRPRLGTARRGVCDSAPRSARRSEPVPGERSANGTRPSSNCWDVPMTVR
jgi:hypothetical protein